MNELVIQSVTYGKLASPFLLGIGIFLLILTVLNSLPNLTYKKPKVVGTYNPLYDTMAKSRIPKTSNNVQYFSISLIILAAIPWIIDILVLNPPTR